MKRNISDNKKARPTHRISKRKQDKPGQEVIISKSDKDELYSRF